MRAGRAEQFTLFAYELTGYFYYASRHVPRTFKTINSLRTVTREAFPPCNVAETERLEVS